MKQTSKSPRTALVYDFKIVAKIWKLEPSLILWAGLWAILWAAIDSGAVYFRNALFNALDVSDNFMDVAIFIFVLAAIYVFFFIPDHIYNHLILPVLDRRLRAKIHAELYKKAQGMDISCYDDPDFYNEFVWAMRESDNHAMATLGSFFSIIHRIIATTAITGLMISINVAVGIIIFAGVLLSFFVDLFAERYWLKKSYEANILWRRRDYVIRTFYLSDYAKEMRTSRAPEMLTRDYDENDDRRVGLEIKYGKIMTLIYGIGYNISRQVTYYATLLIMIGELVKGNVLIGGFAAAITALTMLRSILTQLAEAIVELPKHALYLEK